jgi:hypothetical protein
MYNLWQLLKVSSRMSFKSIVSSGSPEVNVISKSLTLGQATMTEITFTLT